MTFFKADRVAWRSGITHLPLQMILCGTDQFEVYEVVDSFGDELTYIKGDLLKKASISPKYHISPISVEDAATIIFLES